MRYFHSYAPQVMYVTRKSEYYMDLKTAKRVAIKLVSVFGCESSPNSLANIVKMFCNGMDEDGFLGDGRSEGFTPRELSVVRDLMSWYSYEYHDSKAFPSFVVSDLNTGRTLIITNRNERGTSSSAPGHLTPELSLREPVEVSQASFEEATCYYCGTKYTRGFQGLCSHADFMEDGSGPWCNDGLDSLY